MTSELIADHVEKGLDELEKIADRTLEHAAITSAQAVTLKQGIRSVREQLKHLQDTAPRKPGPPEPIDRQRG